MTSIEASVDTGGNTAIIFDRCAKQRTPPARAAQEVITSTRGARACPVGSLVHSDSVSALCPFCDQAGGFGLLTACPAQSRATASRPLPPRWHPDSQLALEGVASGQTKASKLRMLDSGVRMRQEIRLMIGSPQELVGHGARRCEFLPASARTTAHDHQREPGAPRRNSERSQWGSGHGLVAVFHPEQAATGCSRRAVSPATRSQRDDLLMSDPGR